MAFRIPVVTWGANFSGSFELGYPPEQALAFPEKRGGAKTFQAVSGVEDTWTFGTDNILTMTVRWIPTDTGTTPKGDPITGWDGPGGVDEFITHARDANIIRWHADGQFASGSFVPSTVVEIGDPTLEEADGTRTFTLRIRNPNTPYLGY